MADDVRITSNHQHMCNKQLACPHRKINFGHPHKIHLSVIEFTTLPNGLPLVSVLMVDQSNHTTKAPWVDMSSTHLETDTISGTKEYTHP